LKNELIGTTKQTVEHFEEFKDQQVPLLDINNSGAFRSTAKGAHFLISTGYSLLAINTKVNEPCINKLGHYFLLLITIIFHRAVCS
jgi:hypothetical protein